jgi:hypothetical protein
MRTLCALAIMIAGAGLIAGFPSRYAQACDDDRYPCPVRELAAQETVGAGRATAANVVEAASKPAQLIDPKQSNDLNRGAAATYGPSWIAYLLLLLATAFVAALTTIWIRHLAAMSRTKKPSKLSADERAFLNRIRSLNEEETEKRTIEEQPSSPCRTRRWRLALGAAAWQLAWRQ